MRGVRLGFAEIEATVATVRGVLECAVIAVSHQEAGEALALYVVAAEDAGDVVAAVRRRLPSEWICDSISLVTELPRNAYGKLMRSQLAQMIGSAAPETAARGPSSMQRALAVDEASRT